MPLKESLEIAHYRYRLRKAQARLVLRKISHVLAATTNYIIAAFFITALIAVTKFMPLSMLVLGNESGLPSNYAGETVGEYVGILLNALNDIPWAATLITMLTWGLVGLICYLIYFVIANTLIDARNEIISDIDSYVGAHISPGLLVRHAFAKLVAIVAYVVLIAVSFMYLLDVWLDMMGIFVLSGMHLDLTLIYMVGGCIGLFVNVYLIIAMAFLIWRNNSSIV